MATRQGGETVTIVSSGALVAYQAITPAGGTPANAAAVSAGVTTHAVAAAGQDVSVQISGIAKMLASKALAVGTEVGGDAAGKAVDANAGNRMGVVMSASSAADEVIEVLLLPGSLG